MYAATDEESGGCWVDLAGEGCCCESLFLRRVAGLCRRDVQDEALVHAMKLELHSVLNAFQASPKYGVHICESFRDPRKHDMDDYWAEVQFEALSVDELHKAVGSFDKPLSDDGRARMHQLARMLERLSKRIDRIVLG